MRRSVLVSPLSRWIDPADAFAALYADVDDVFWLDSGVDAATGMSYLGTAARTVTARATGGSRGTGTVHENGRERSVAVLDFLREELAGGVEADERAGPFQLGWVGWLGYELHAQTMGGENPGSEFSDGFPNELASGLASGPAAGGESRHPDAALMFVDRAIAFDHATRTVRLLALGESWEGDLAAWHAHVLAHLDLPSSRFVRKKGRRGALPPGTHRAETGETGVWRDGDAEYLSKVRASQRAIRDGDAYQLCLTTHVHVAVKADPAATYLALRESSPSHHGAFLRIAGVSLLSASPEQFLVVTPDGTVETKPIKGTRPRGATAVDDERLRRELVDSEKERAENLMIVDLMRNDIGRVCEVGSVTVPSLFAVESYAHVHQLVSTIRGRLAPDMSPTDAVAACFPAGSMTGAPKRSAMSILQRLEGHPRGIYSGAFGYFGLDGRVDLAMVIRSIVLDDEGATIGTGGGITALSVPQEELAEVKLKAAALLAVLGVAGSLRLEVGSER